MLNQLSCQTVFCLEWLELVCHTKLFQACKCRHSRWSGMQHDRPFFCLHHFRSLGCMHSWPHAWCQAFSDHFTKCSQSILCGRKLLERQQQMHSTMHPLQTAGSCYNLLLQLAVAAKLTGSLRSSDHRLLSNIGSASCTISPAGLGVRYLVLFWVRNNNQTDTVVGNLAMAV